MIWLSAIDLVLLIILYAVESQVAERHWFGTFITYAPQHFFGVPAAGFAIWAGIRRDKRALVVNMLAIVFFAVALLGFRVPWRAIVHSTRGTGASRPITLGVMTYNIHHSPHGVASVAREIHKISPDVLCLQEANSLSGGVSLLGEITKLAGKWYVIDYGELIVVTGYPIKRHEICRMEYATGRALLKVVLDVGGREVTVVNVHLNSSLRPRLGRDEKVPIPQRLSVATGLRSVQVGALRSAIEGVRTPLIVAGDFNTPPVGPVYRQITANLTDAFGNSGWGLGHTFRADFPVMRIDYILLGGGAYARNCVVPNTRVSDHRPVVADVEIPL